ncbi:MAG: hypothetical protein V1694_12780 [Candidatus Eisenbacteria bacterium]
MRKLVVIVAAVAMVAALGADVACAKDKQASNGMTAVERAAKDKKYLFIFLYSDEGEQTASMRKIFNDAVTKASRTAKRVEINVTDPAETALIDKFAVRGAPMPLVLAVAPNGAITGGLPAPFSEQQILDAFATPCTQAAVKALQENKVVLLCIQNRNTKLNDAAMKGVQDFKADPARAASTEIVTLDPSDPAESRLLGMLAVDPKIDQATTVCLIAPGRAVGKFAGATTKEMIAASLKSGGGGGCCPGGATSGAKGCGPVPSGQAAAKPGGTASSANPGGAKPGSKAAGK